MKLLRRSDRFTLNFEDYMEVKGVKFELRPLSFDQKFEIQTCTKMKGGKEIIDGLTSTKLAVKYAVTGCSGITTMDGEEYELEFDDDGNLSDGCLDDLLNMHVSGLVGNLCISSLNGYPDEILDHETGEIVEGVKIKLGKLQ